jgi:hypothetical protein
VLLENDERVPRAHGIPVVEGGDIRRLEDEVPDRLPSVMAGGRGSFASQP